MGRKGQVSLEFIIIFAFALIIFILLLALMLQFLESGRQNRILREFEYVSDSIAKNLLIASKGPGIVELQLALPDSIAGLEYTVNNNMNTLVISAIGADYSVTRSIPDISSGSFVAGKTHIIKRENDGTIIITVS